jgi:hypothetical protein
MPLPWRRFCHVIVCAGLIGALAGVGTRRAEADTSAAPGRPERARTLFNEGLEYSDAGRWQEAADRFRRAYQEKPTAEIAYNLAQVYLRLGYLAGGAELFRRAAEDPQAAAAVREAARARLAQVSPRLGRLTVVLEPRPGAVAYLDGRPLDRGRLGAGLPVDPGPHLVQARWGDGSDLSRRIMVAEGGDSTVMLVPPRAADTAAARPLVRRGWFWVAVVGVAAGTALVLTLPHLGKSSGPQGNVGTWPVDP